MTDESAWFDFEGNESDFSRREIFQHVAFLGGVVYLGASCKNEPPKPEKTTPAVPASPVPLKILTFEEFQILSAVVDRILPKDEDPGALETGVASYIDLALTAPQIGHMKKNFGPGLQALNRRCQKLHQTPFVNATDAQKDDVISIFKNSPESSGEARWYEMLIVLTLEGFLGDPSYGGNKNEAGWKLVGFNLVGRTPADPTAPYDGQKRLQDLKCGEGKGC